MSNILLPSISKSEYSITKYAEWWSFWFEFDDLDYYVQFNEARDPSRSTPAHFNLYVGEYTDITALKPTSWRSVSGDTVEYGDAHEMARKLIPLAKIHAMMTS
jgi:hypothetical protein